MKIEDIFKADKYSVWDATVPIVKEDRVTRAYLTDAISEPADYNELCYRLNAATSDDTFYLHINTYGGMIDSAFMICDAIKHSKARVVAHLSGTVASAGTIITMACNDIIVSDHLSFMVHNYSSGLAGKGHEMKAQQKFMDSSLNDAFKEFYIGFLSEEEMEDIIDGKDLWIGSSDVKVRWDQKKA